MSRVARIVEERAKKKSAKKDRGITRAELDAMRSVRALERCADELELLRVLLTTGARTITTGRGT